jgi:hypothetical protein
VGLELPGELVYVFGLIGLNWPEADEEALFELGTAWLDFSGSLTADGQDAAAVADAVRSGNSGPAVDAFLREWTDNGTARSFRISAEAAAAFGAGLVLYAAVVLGLKINVIVQLVILAAEIAEAVATAGPTFGASLAEIPVFQQITRSIVEGLIWQVVGEILGG